MRTKSTTRDDLDHLLAMLSARDSRDPQERIDADAFVNRVLDINAHIASEQSATFQRTTSKIQSSDSDSKQSVYPDFGDW